MLRYVRKILGDALALFVPSVKAWERSLGLLAVSGLIVLGELTQDWPRWWPSIPLGTLLLWAIWRAAFNDREGYRKQLEPVEQNARALREWRFTEGHLSGQSLADVLVRHRHRITGGRYTPAELVRMTIEPPSAPPEPAVLARVSRQVEEALEELRFLRLFKREAWNGTESKYQPRPAGYDVILYLARSDSSSSPISSRSDQA